MGSLITDARGRLKLSQAELAAAVGVSQATISRIEQNDSGLVDIQLAVKVAKKLELRLGDLLASEAQAKIDSWSDDVFYAFCPNPFCELNLIGRSEDGDVFVSWRSGEIYSFSRFAEINFCHRCGTELVKECPNCQRRLTERKMKHCVTCGHKVTSRPTDGEWDLIRELNPPSHPTPRSADPIDGKDFPF